MAKGLLYISTNQGWSGSEELWYASAVDFLRNGVPISIAVNYHHSNINAIKHELSGFVDLTKRYEPLNILRRFSNKISRKKAVEKDYLVENLKTTYPSLAIISQGNNISSLDEMETCIQHNIPFVTISQLIAKIHLLNINEVFRRRLISAYNLSLKNYFVSKNNIELHEFMLGYNATNSEVIHNPYILTNLTVPYAVSEKYAIAFVGRLECYHKGIDILLEVLAAQKWQKRPVVFNFYGKGPHELLIKDMAGKLGIQNLHIRGFTGDVSSVWGENHLLILPSRMEGQSLALIECLYNNRTAVVTAVGGADEIICDNETGFIAKYTTVQSIDDAMERAWMRKEEWETMGVKAGEMIRGIMPNNAVKFFNEKIDGLIY